MYMLINFYFFYDRECYLKDLFLYKTKRERKEFYFASQFHEGIFLILNSIKRVILTVKNFKLNSIVETENIAYKLNILL